jgi:2-polyprenyl-3-methyl-5-hydroxy-6-metoxy-1,4-benzoquinol methylase
MSSNTLDIEPEWYRSAFTRVNTEMHWGENQAGEIDRVLAMLEPEGSDLRVLDLACGSGPHSIEMARRGFSVVGVDLAPELLEIARNDAEAEGLEISFLEADLRELDFEDEFDIVLSLNDGAIGYFETEEENLRTFEVVAKVLRPGGQHLMQIPNILYAQKNYPEKTWMESSSMVELWEYEWDEETKYMQGTTTPVRIGEVFEGRQPIPFRQRLYSIDEIKEIFAPFGVSVANAFRGGGKARMPNDRQFEVFVESRKE